MYVLPVAWKLLYLNCNYTTIVDTLIFGFLRQCKNPLFTKVKSHAYEYFPVYND